MEMNVSVTDLSENQKKLQVEIPAQKVQQELERKYRDLAKRVRLKGFRPGKVPRSILKSYYGKTVENEVSSQFIQDTFPEALRQVDLKPLVEASVDEIQFEDDGAFAYSAIVDVSPPFEVEGYKGLEITKPPVHVDEDQIEAELNRIREQHAQVRPLESDRPAAVGDVAVVDFTPRIGDAVFEKGQTYDQMVQIGKNSIHPDFDRQLVGHSKGESIAFDLDYPEDAPTPELAGKTVHFDVVIKDVKERVLPEPDDEFARSVGKYDSIEALRVEIGQRLREREEQKATSMAHQQIIDQLVSRIDFEISSKVIEREIDRLVGILRHQFESQGLKVDSSMFNSPEIRADYRPQAERNLRWRLICERIAQAEGIELTEKEIDDIYGEVARMARMDPAEVRQKYADSSIVEQAKESKIQDKVLSALEETAVIKETSEKEDTTNEE